MAEFRDDIAARIGKIQLRTPNPVAGQRPINVGASEVWDHHLSRTGQITEGITANYNWGSLLGNGLRLAGAGIGAALFIDGIRNGVKVFTGTPVSKDANGNPVAADWGTGLRAGAEVVGGAALAVGSLAIGGRRNFLHGHV